MHIGSAVEPLPASLNARIQAEVSRLWALLETIPAFDGSGDDHQEAIEAQLSVLAEGLTRVEVLDEFGDECTEAYILDAALAAVDWLWEGGESPSAGWFSADKVGMAAYSIN